MTEEEKKREEKYGIYYHEMNYGEVGRGLASLIQKLAGNEKKKKEQEITVVIRDTTSSKDREWIKELKTWTREEIIEGIRETEKNENQRWVVSGAKVVCTAMAGTKSSCSMIKLRGGIEVQGGLALSQKDITFEPLFTGCQNVDGNRCKPEIENEEWQEYDEGNSLGNGEFALLKEESYMFCLYGGGLLYITDDGQREPELERLIQEDRGEAEGSGQLVTKQQLTDIMTAANHFQANAVNDAMVNELNDMLQEYNIIDKQQIQMFLAVITHESRLALTEAGWLSNAAVRHHSLQYEPGTSKGNNLGNTAAGDGYLFRGAGYIQLTGRDNYRYFSAYIKNKSGEDADIMNNGADCIVSKYAWKAAGYFWEKNNINQIIANGNTNGLATMDIFKKVSNTVYQGNSNASSDPDGWSDRKNRLNEVMSLYY